MKMIRFASTILPLVVMACGGGPTAPLSSVSSDQRTCSVLPLRLLGVRSITPSPEWPSWYAQAEACSGRGGDFGRVRWFLVDRIDQLDGSPSRIVGVTCADDIYLIDRFEPTARHEMLHHILNQSGHPAEFFPRCAEDLTSTSPAT